jgi:hypothetical protein
MELHHFKAVIGICDLINAKGMKNSVNNKMK